MTLFYKKKQACVIKWLMLVVILSHNLKHNIMGSVLKFIAFAFLALFILAFALPLFWLVIQEIGLLFGGLFLGIGGANLFWVVVFVISIIAIIVMLSN